MKKYFFFLFLLLLTANIINAQNKEERLLRFPAVHGNQAVFTYAGDLYTVPIEGGTARKLTSYNNGYEMFARFSPDGKNIAFTGQYDGNTEVFLIPAKGGIPKRLTYTATLRRDNVSDRMGPNNIVMTWRDNNHIIFRSRKQSFNSFKGQLFDVSVEGGLSKELPLPSGGFCSFSPDGKKLAYNRVFREFRTWKYYKGGMADDIWIYDFDKKNIENITNNDAQDIFPMWHDDKIYFLSDRDRTMNLFVYNTKTKEITKLTEYNEYDIKFPSLGDKYIIYENGGYLYTYNLDNGEIKKITVFIKNDLITGRDALKDASKLIRSYAVSPDGKRVAFGARGDIYTLPGKQGITRNLTQSSGVHERNVEWSPDGAFVSYISDKTGEDEIYIQKQNGLEPEIQLTTGSETYKYNPIWSPDSKKLLWSDKMGKLLYVNIDTKQITSVVEDSKDWEIRDYTWSPDSRWIAYTLPKNRGVNRIYVYNIESKETKPVTDIWYNASSPEFDPEGKYLYFVSSRDFNPIYSWTEWNHAYQDMDEVYLITLRKDIPSPFLPENDEVKLSKKDQNKTEQTKKSSNKKNYKSNASDDNILKITIDFDGIIDRVVKITNKSGSYWNLSAVKGKLYYAYNSSIDETTLKYYDFKSKKEKEIGKTGTFIISANGKKMLIGMNKKYSVIDLPSGKINPDHYLDLSDMKTFVNLQKEWEEIFNESWRQMRDFFYAPNMHGVDWDKIYKKYNTLVPYVKNRNDLNYLIGEMIGELSVGHAYVNGGDLPKPKRIKTGLLGAKISKDDSGYFKIDKILKGENWYSNTISPLTLPGIKIYEGDYIIAVNGKSVKETNDIYTMLIGKAGKEVMLTVNSSPSKEDAHDEIVVPISDEANLYYYNWVRNNIEKVNKATNGQVGYIHIPDMGREGLNEFVKLFYPQLNKKALIIDDRGNGGGNVSPMIIERLARQLTLYGMSRNNNVTTKPRQMMLGPKVLLIDNYSASDGDLFPYQFKKLKLGTVIGVRSWGGVVGIRGSLPLVDGGDLRKPEFAPFDTEGHWAIEGHGVDPDIVVDNNPVLEYEGIDEQLNKAIEVVLEQIKDYKPIPEIPPYPDKSK
jgi:tricorn protease